MNTDWGDCVGFVREGSRLRPSNDVNWPEPLACCFRGNSRHLPSSIIFAVAEFIWEVYGEFKGRRPIYFLTSSKERRAASNERWGAATRCCSHAHGSEG